MFLPLGDEPNPRGVPFVTYAIIAANAAVYVFITLPLSSTAPSLNDPALREYVQVISRMIPEGMSMREVLSSLSAYDLFTFAWGYRPVEPSPVTLLTGVLTPKTAWAAPIRQGSSTTPMSKTSGSTV